MSDIIKKFEEQHNDMSDREIMNAKFAKKETPTFINDGSPVQNKILESQDPLRTQPSPAVEEFESEYPSLSMEFKKIQKEMYEMFAAKHMDYGLNNISLGGDIINNNDDKKFSLTGLAIRLTDKISRLKNLLVNGRNFVKGEAMEDTFLDVANYGIIGLLVGRNKWKK
jgi:hypothetical protein